MIRLLLDTSALIALVEGRLHERVRDLLVSPDAAVYASVANTFGRLRSRVFGLASWR